MQEINALNTTVSTLLLQGHGIVHKEANDSTVRPVHSVAGSAAHQSIIVQAPPVPPIQFARQAIFYSPPKPAYTQILIYSDAYNASNFTSPDKPQPVNSNVDRTTGIRRRPYQRFFISGAEEPKSHALKPAAFRTINEAELAYAQQYRAMTSIKVNISINGVHINALIDTGSDLSYISSETVGRVFWNTPYLPVNGRSSAAVGGGNEVYGPLFSYASTPFGRILLRLVVFPGLNEDLILGMDFLLHPSIKAGIDFKQMTLRIGNVTINVTESVTGDPFKKEFSELDASTVVSN